jgi:hypothetical protein
MTEALRQNALKSAARLDSDLARWENFSGMHCGALRFCDIWRAARPLG